MASREKDIGRLAAGAATAGAGFLGGPVGAALVGGGISLAQSIWSAKRADSAHQREVRDLRRAGLNPMLGLRGSGAEVGQQESVTAGASSALAVRRANAEIALLEAQARRENSAAGLAKMQTHEIATYAPGRGAQATSAADASAAAAEFSRLQASQQRQLFDSVLAKAREEVRLVSSSARANEARAVLDELAQAGAENTERYEREFWEMYERLGESGPWLRTLGIILQQLRR